MRVSAPPKPSRRSISAAANPAVAAPNDDDAFALPYLRNASGSRRCGASASLSSLTKSAVLALHPPAGDRRQRRRRECLTGAKAEASVMPRATYRVAHHQTFRERAAVVSARCADRKQLIPRRAIRTDLFAHAPRQQGAVGQSRSRGSRPEDRDRWAVLRRSWQYSGRTHATFRRSAKFPAAPPPRRGNRLHRQLGEPVGAAGLGREVSQPPR